MQFEDLHTAESDFFMKIDVAAELSARNVVNEYLTPSGFKPVRLDDSRAYFIPQQRAEGSSPSITVRYGSIVELVVTYPTENDLRKALFQLHEMEYGTRPCGFFEYRAATENYERVLKRRRADIPPNLTQSPTNCRSLNRSSTSSASAIVGSVRATHPTSIASTSVRCWLPSSTTLAVMRSRSFYTFHRPCSRTISKSLWLVCESSSPFIHQPTN